MDYVTKDMHDEFSRRMEEENNRQNNRIKLLEEDVRQINNLTVSVKEMAITMKNRLEEQRKQGERLERLEKEPGESHKQIKMAIVSAVISTVVTAVVTAILLLI